MIHSSGLAPPGLRPSGNTHLGSPLPRPHLEASHVDPQQMIFARSLSKSSYDSSWKLRLGLKHVQVNAMANVQLPALPL